VATHDLLDIGDIAVHCNTDNGQYQSFFSDPFDNGKKASELIAATDLIWRY
jgi:hypothetical protein